LSRNTPVHQIRSGYLQAAVWQNVSPSGPRYSITFDRLYLIGGAWQSYPARNFASHELPVVTEVVVRVREWIASQHDEPCGLVEPAVSATV
jgi:hypothetical protein